MALLIFNLIIALCLVVGAQLHYCQVNSYFVTLHHEMTPDQVMDHFSVLQKNFRVSYSKDVSRHDVNKILNNSTSLKEAELHVKHLYQIPGFLAYLVVVNGGGGQNDSSLDAITDRFLLRRKDLQLGIKAIEKNGKASIPINIVDGSIDGNSSISSLLTYRLSKEARSQILHSFYPSVGAPHNNLDKSLSTQGLATWNLARISNRAASSQISTTYTYDSSAGSGVDVYIVDSGINTGQLDFLGRAKMGDDFTGDGLQDDIGHGTHVAGIVGGTIFGASKNVQMIGVKVFGQEGTADWGTILSGINWAFQQARSSNSPSIINLSLRGEYSATVNLAVEAIVLSGVPVVAAAGNDGGDACSYSPGSSPAPVVVGATMPGDLFYQNTNTGSCVDILAPGQNILSDWIGSAISVHMLSGTSMAAPHVSGVLALLWSQRSWLKASDLIDLVKGIATSNLIANVPSNTANLLLYNQLE